MVSYRSTHSRSLAFALALMLCLAWPVAGQDFYLQANDSVVFFSNADTAAPAWKSLVETFLLLRFPSLSIQFTDVTQDPNFDAATLRGRRAVVVASAEDAASPTFRGFYEKVKTSAAQRCLTVLRNGAGQEVGEPGALVVDVAAALEVVAGKVRATDPDLAATFISGIPPGHARALLIAGAVLEAWHAPGLVSAVEIDGLRGAATRVERTTVRDMENGRVMAWTQDDEALPMAFDFMDQSVGAAIQASGLAVRLNGQTLRIRGMAAERYTFTIDGERIGIFHRDQLDAGINLALLRTPMWKRAMAVLALTRKHEELRAKRRRFLEAGPEQRKSAEWRAAMETLDAEEAALVEEQAEKAKAGTHDYELQPVEQE
ncbi:MAG: hypothetical protein C5B56_07810 [Proteobacteria bacterium]|nr:MAG: hypothetical protein C5B56_07810 [Pseudomonadota bacterium]